METAAIVTRNLSCHFGSVRAVDGLTLEVQHGTVFGFLGPNGVGKTTTIRRNVALGKVMIAKLRFHADLQQQERILAGEKWQENNLVIATNIGTPMDPRQLFKVFKRLLRQAGLPDIRFHDLRHSAATVMLSWGINPKAAQERLGHARISYTLGTYSHVLPTIQVEAAEKMDKLILDCVE